MLDVTRDETFQYVANEVRKVPPSIPICILANFFDQPKSSHRVSREMIEKLQDSISPALTPFVRSIVGARKLDSASCAPATVIEMSLATGYGMSVLHSYLGVPFSFSKAIQAEEHVRAAFDSVRSACQRVNGLCADQNFDQYMLHLRERELACAQSNSISFQCDSEKEKRVTEENLPTAKSFGEEDAGDHSKKSTVFTPSKPAPVSGLSVQKTLVATIKDTTSEDLDSFFGCEPEASDHGAVSEMTLNRQRVLRQLSQPRKQESQ